MKSLLISLILLTVTIISVDDQTKKQKDYANNQLLKAKLELIKKR